METNPFSASSSSTNYTNSTPASPTEHVLSKSKEIFLQKIESLNKELLTVNQVLTNANHENARLKEHIFSQSHSMHQLHMRYSACETDNQRLIKELHVIGQQLKTCNEYNERLVNGNVTLEKENDELTGHVQGLSDEVIELQKQCKQVKQENATLIEKNAKLTQEMRNPSNNISAAELKDLRQKALAFDSITYKENRLEQSRGCLMYSLYGNLQAADRYHAQTSVSAQQIDPGVASSSSSSSSHVSSSSQISTSTLQPPLPTTSTRPPNPFSSTSSLRPFYMDSRPPAITIHPRREF